MEVVEVVVTTGATNHARLQSNHHHQQTNIQLFTRWKPFLSPLPTMSSTEGKMSHFRDLLIPSLIWVFQPCLWLLKPLLPRAKLPCLSSAFWRQYPRWFHSLNKDIPPTSSSFPWHEGNLWYDLRQAVLLSKRPGWLISPLKHERQDYDEFQHIGCTEILRDSTTPIEDLSTYHIISVQ